MKRLVITAVVLAAGLSSRADYNIYVRANGGSDSNNGKSYATAYATFGKALSTATSYKETSSSEGSGYAIKNIYFYPGTYRVAPRDASGNPYGNNQDISIGCKNIHFIGVDDDGSGDVRMPADPKDVIIDGDGVMRIVTTQYNHGMQFYNLTLQNGIAGSAYCSAGGGLLYLNGVNCCASNCVFRNGTAVSGGAVYVNAQMDFTDCHFYDCAATNGTGGAISCPTYASPVLTRCTFTRCRSTRGAGPEGTDGSGGGALALSSAANQSNGFYLYDCDFTANLASAGGGAVRGGVNCASNCTFVGNVSSNVGAATYFHCLGTSCHTNTFIDCDFFDNIAYGGSSTNATTAHRGGIITRYAGYPHYLRGCRFGGNVSYGMIGLLGNSTDGGSNNKTFVYDCEITNNVVRTDRIEKILAANPGVTCDAYKWGTFFDMRANGAVMSNCVFRGNVFPGAYAFANLSENSLITDCTFVNNYRSALKRFKATWEGVVSTDGSGNTIRNCLIVGNVNSNATAYAMGLFIATDQANTRVENCTICDNVSFGPYYSQYPVGLYGYFPTKGKNCALYNTVCSGNMRTNGVVANAYWSASAYSNYVGNAAADPRFRDRSKGDYRLRASSPLRDAGCKLGWMDPPALDLDGQPRLNGSAPDIGCYEFWPYSGFFMFVR